MTMELFDSHCHMDVEAFDEDRGEVLAAARHVGVRRMLVPAVDSAHWQGLLELCNKEPGLYPALGMHPVFLDRHQPEHLAQLEAAIAAHRPAAIGEIGLDFYIPDTDRTAQQTLFEAQLTIARDANLPVVLHVRKAHDPVLQALKRIPVPGGFSHAFNGSLQQARQYIDMGFKLGFGGMLTYERSSKLRKLARELPLEALVLETDAPDMTVASHQGGRNSPAYLPECASALAAIRGCDPTLIGEQTTRNACDVLGLDC